MPERNLKVTNFMVIKVKKELARKGHSGSGLYCDRHKNKFLSFKKNIPKICFEGIQRACAVKPDEFGNIDVFFVPRDSIFQNIKEATHLYYYCTKETEYLKDYFKSKKADNISEWMDSNNRISSEITMIIDVKDIAQVPVHLLRNNKINKIYIYRVGSIVSIKESVLEVKNIVPYFMNSDLDRSWNCINSKWNKSAPVDLHYSTETKNCIYLAYHGFLGQQAALTVYTALTQFKIQVFENIFYDDVINEYHDSATSAAQIIVIFLTDSWFKNASRNNGILSRLRYGKKGEMLTRPIVIIQSADIQFKFDTLDLPTLTYKSLNEIPKLICRLEEKSKQTYTSNSNNSYTFESNIF